MTPLTRRGFLVAGAGAPLLAFAQPPGRAPHAPGRFDPMLDQLLDQLITNAQAMQVSGARAEHLRAQANTLRSVAVYGASVRDLDTRLKGQLAAQVRRQGRGRVLAEARRQYDAVCASCEARLAAKGVDVTAVPTPTMPLIVAPDQQNAVLDRALATGVTPALLEQADVLDSLAPALERLRGPLLVQALENDHDRTCRAYQALIISMEAFAAFVCWDPLLWEFCIILQIDVFALRIASWWNGC